MIKYEWNFFIYWKEKMNQKKQLLKNTVIIAIGKLSTQIVSFLLLPLYTAKLATEEFGTYDFFVTLSVFLLPIITLLMEEFGVEVKNHMSVIEDEDAALIQELIGENGIPQEKKSIVKIN